MTVSTAPPSTTAVAALGLAGTEHSVLDQPVEPTDWAVFRSDVRQQKLTGVLLAAVEQGSFPATESQVSELVEDHVRAMAGALMLERLLLGVVTRLQARGVDFRVLGGPAVAHLDYSAPELRCFLDISLLVRSDQAAAIAHILQDFGLSRPHNPYGVDGSPQLGSEMQFHAEDGALVRVHHDLAGPPIGRCVQSCDVRGSAACRFVLGGVEIPALTRELRLLSSAYATIGAGAAPASVTLRDIAEIALHPGLDTPLAIELASECRGRAALASAVRSAWSQLRIGDVTALSAWAESYRPTDRERRELALQGDTSVATARMPARLAARVHDFWYLRTREGRAQLVADHLRRTARQS